MLTQNLVCVLARLCCCGKQVDVGRVPRLSYLQSGQPSARGDHAISPVVVPPSLQAWTEERGRPAFQPQADPVMSARPPAVRTRVRAHVCMCFVHGAAPAMH